MIAVALTRLRNVLQKEYMKRFFCCFFLRVFSRRNKLTARKTVGSVLVMYSTFSYIQYHQVQISAFKLKAPDFKAGELALQQRGRPFITRKNVVLAHNILI